MYVELKAQDSPSYSTALANLGALYKQMAIDASDESDKQQYFKQAESYLNEALELRIKLSGKDVSYPILSIHSRYQASTAICT